MKGVLLLNLVKEKVNIIDARNNEFLKEEFFKQNLGLVYKVVYKLNNLQMDTDEKISIGQFALLKAFNTYNPEKYEFSTYAIKCITNEILYEYRKSYYKYSKTVQSLNKPIHKSSGGVDLLLLDTIPEKFEDYGIDDFNSVIKVYNEFINIYSKKDPQLVEAFKMYVFENKTTKYIADRYNLVQSSGSRMVARAIKAIQEIAIKMDIIDNFNSHTKKIKSGDVKKKKEKEDGIKRKILYIILNYPELSSHEISEITNWSIMRVVKLKESYDKGTFKLSPDDSIKLKVEKYLANKKLYS
jgi:RNA polymerase sigma factor (sigma-70 family)